MIAAPYSPGTKRFLTAIHVCMQRENAASWAREAKSKRIKFKPTLSAKDFTSNEIAFIRELIEKLWGMQADAATTSRVMAAMSGDTQSLIAAAQANIAEWGDIIYGPGLSRSVGVAGESMSAAIGDAIGERLFFDLTEDSIQKWLTEDAAELVVQMTRQQILAIKGVIKSSIKNNWTFLEAKELLRPGMTLTARESTWVTNFYNRQYNELYKEYSKTLSHAKAAAKARANALRRQQRYFRKTLDTRMERIARTELHRAYGAAQESSFIQARSLGKIKDVRRTWRRTSGHDNHQSSIDNDGVTKPLGEPFTGGGQSMMFESEINGQCIVEFDFRRVER